MTTLPPHPAERDSAPPGRAPLCRFAPLLGPEDFERFIGEFTNYERMKDYRYAGDTLSLERMEGLARDLGNPQESYPAVHIAGTKGKGSTTLILEALLAASGYRVGAYTSPHVERLEERVRVEGRSIAPAELASLATSILPCLEARWADGPTRFPTFFELMTGLAMLHFQRRKVDWAIFEVGLGGRLDATNILRPRWTAITSIGLEHTDKLGATLDRIAWEKAGIVKASTPLVLGDLPPDAEEVVLEVVRARKAVALRPRHRARLVATRGSLEVSGPAAGQRPLLVPPGAVRGPGLRADLELALELWWAILEEEGRPSRREDLEAALAGLHLPARAELLPGDPPAVVDGAHTPESVRSLRAALEEMGFPRPRGLVLALGADKALEPILAEARGMAEQVVATRADSTRGRDPEEIASRLAQLGVAARAVEDPEEALQAAVQGQKGVVVTGSFYLAGKLRPILRKRG